MKNNKLFLFTFICLLSLCSCAQKKPQLGTKGNAIKEVLTSTSKAIESKYDIKCVGNTYAAMYKVEELGLRFFYYDKMDIEDGREIILDIAKTLTENVKSNKAIQPYLMESGFGYENVDITIFIKENQKTSLAPDLGVISCFNNKIIYKTYNKEAYETRGVPKTEIVFSETYSEALIALESQHPQEAI